MKKIIFILCVISFVVSAENNKPTAKNARKLKSPELELTIEEKVYLKNKPELELSADKEVIEIEPVEEEETLDLELTAKEAHIKKPAEDEVPLWKVMASGMLRGFANIALSPGELVRGFTYEFTARKWYYAIFTSGVEAVGGTMARMGSGLADIGTLGYFGDILLAEGFPDYVWEGDWVCHKENPANKPVEQSQVLAENN